MSIETTSLTLGPVRLNIAAQDAALHAAVRLAYRSFVVPAANDDQAFTLHIDYASGPAPADWPFAFERGILHFTAAHYTGRLNLHAPHTAQRAYLNVVAPHPFEPVDYFVRAALSLLIFEMGGLLFHAAGLVRRRQGYAFFGYSGSGKTTLARVSTDAVVLNDDLVMLHPAAHGWTMHATPFSNPTQVTPSAPQSASLTALYRLVQAPRVWVEPLERAVAIAEIIASSPVICADPERALPLLVRAEQLVTAVPVQRLHFLPDDSFWSVIQP